MDARIDRDRMRSKALLKPRGMFRSVLLSTRLAAVEQMNKSAAAAAVISGLTDDARAEEAAAAAAAAAAKADQHGSDSDSQEEDDVVQRSAGKKDAVGQFLMGVVQSASRKGRPRRRDKADKASAAGAGASSSAGAAPVFAARAYSPPRSAAALRRQLSRATSNSSSMRPGSAASGGGVSVSRGGTPQLPAGAGTGAGTGMGWYGVSMASSASVHNFLWQTEPSQLASPRPASSDATGGAKKKNASSSEALSSPAEQTRRAFAAALAEGDEGTHSPSGGSPIFTSLAPPPDADVFTQLSPAARLKLFPRHAAVLSPALPERAPLPTPAVEAPFLIPAVQAFLRQADGPHGHAASSGPGTGGGQGYAGSGRAGAKAPAASPTDLLAAMKANMKAERARRGAWAQANADASPPLSPLSPAKSPASMAARAPGSVQPVSLPEAALSAEPHGEARAGEGDGAVRVETGLETAPPQSGTDTDGVASRSPRSSPPSPVGADGSEPASQALAVAATSPASDTDPVEPEASVAMGSAEEAAPGRSEATTAVDGPEDVRDASATAGEQATDLASLEPRVDAESEPVREPEPEAVPKHEIDAEGNTVAEETEEVPAEAASSLSLQPAAPDADGADEGVGDLDMNLSFLGGVRAEALPFASPLSAQENQRLTASLALVEENAAKARKKLEKKASKKAEKAGKGKPPMTMLELIAAAKIAKAAAAEVRRVRSLRVSGFPFAHVLVECGVGLLVCVALYRLLPPCCVRRRRLRHHRRRRQSHRWSVHRACRRRRRLLCRWSHRLHCGQSCRRPNLR